jgi:hypothetical protein
VSLPSSLSSDVNSLWTPHVHAHNTQAHKKIIKDRGPRARHSEQSLGRDGVWGERFWVWLFVLGVGFLVQDPRQSRKEQADGVTDKLELFFPCVSGVGSGVLQFNVLELDSRNPVHACDLTIIPWRLGFGHRQLGLGRSDCGLRVQGLPCP